MRKIVILIILFSALTTLAFQKGGAFLDLMGGNTNFETTTTSQQQISKEFSLDDYGAIQMYLGGEVIYEQQAASQKANVRIETSDEALKILEINSKNGTLTIGLKKGHKEFNHKLKIYTSSSKLTEVNIAGSVKFVAKGKISTDNIKIRITGSGDANIAELAAKNLNIEVVGSGNTSITKLTAEAVSSNIAGSGNVAMEGKATKGSFVVRGSGNMTAHHLELDDASCNIYGSGNISVYANKTLSISIAGSGKVDYKGNASPNINNSGSGRAKKI